MYGHVNDYPDSFAPSIDENKSFQSYKDRRLQELYKPYEEDTYDLINRIRPFKFDFTFNFDKDFLFYGYVISPFIRDGWTVAPFV